MKTQRPSLSALSILTAATLLAACSSSPDDTAADSSVAVDPAPQSTTSDSTDSEGTDSTETADTVEATTEGSKALSPLGNPTTEDKQQSPGIGTDLVPVGVRVADHDSFTRVVLDFEGTGTAGWFTQLGPEPTQQVWFSASYQQSGKKRRSDSMPSRRSADINAEGAGLSPSAGSRLEAVANPLHFRTPNRTTKKTL